MQHRNTPATARAATPRVVVPRAGKGKSWHGPPRWGTKCWNCDQEGHYARDCTKLTGTLPKPATVAAAQQLAYEPDGCEWAEEGFEQLSDPVEYLAVAFQSLEIEAVAVAKTHDEALQTLKEDLKKANKAKDLSQRSLKSEREEAEKAKKSLEELKGRRFHHSESIVDSELVTVQDAVQGGLHPKTPQRMTTESPTNGAAGGDLCVGTPASDSSFADSSFAASQDSVQRAAQAATEYHGGTGAGAAATTVYCGGTGADAAAEVSPQPLSVSVSGSWLKRAVSEQHMAVWTQGPSTHTDIPVPAVKCTSLLADIASDATDSVQCLAASSINTHTTPTDGVVGSELGERLDAADPGQQPGLEQLDPDVAGFDNPPQRVLTCSTFRQSLGDMAGWCVDTGGMLIVFLIVFYMVSMTYQDGWGFVCQVPGGLLSVAFSATHGASAGVASACNSAVTAAVGPWHDHLEEYSAGGDSFVWQYVALSLLESSWIGALSILSTVWVVLSGMHQASTSYVTLLNQAMENYHPSKRTTAASRSRRISITRWDKAWAAKRARRFLGVLFILGVLVPYDGVQGLMEAGTDAAINFSPASLTPTPQTVVWGLLLLLIYALWTGMRQLADKGKRAGAFLALTGTSIVVRCVQALLDAALLGYRLSRWWPGGHREYHPGWDMVSSQCSPVSCLGHLHFLTMALTWTVSYIGWACCLASRAVSPAARVLRPSLQPLIICVVLIGGTMCLQSILGTVATEHQALTVAAAQSSERFHSCLVEVEMRDPFQGLQPAKLLITVIADSGAGHCFLPAFVVTRLNLPTFTIRSMQLQTADGSIMEGPSLGAEVQFRFTGSTRPESQDSRWHTHPFKVHNSNTAPCIIGNDFWFKQKAAFDFGARCIRLMDNKGMTKETIPFRCSRAEDESAHAAAIAAGKRYQVRATRDMVLQPKEGCSIGPTVQADPGELHCATTLRLIPRLGNDRILLDDDARKGFRKQFMYCTPQALVTPKYVPHEDRCAVATTVINMGSEPLVIRQGDLIAEAVHEAPGAWEDAPELVALADELQHLAKSPTAAFDHDGLPEGHPEKGLSGTESVKRVPTKCPEFKAWRAKFKDQLRVGDADTCPKLKLAVLKLLFCYRDAFADNPSAPSAIAGVEHTIDFMVGTTVVPKKERLRRCNPTELQAMYDATDKMLRDGIIRPSTSPWAANVIMVPKPSDPLKGLRFVVDYRYLNRHCVSDAMILPRIDDLLDSLGTAEVFSMMDAAAGFWGVKIKEEHCERTAFSTWTHGTMEFVRMPFGLRNAPSTFQRALQNILHPYVCNVL